MEPFSCEESSPEKCNRGESCWKKYTDCCPGYKAKIDGEEPFCCSVPTGSENEHCFNQTKYPYSISHLHGSGSEYKSWDPWPRSPAAEQGRMEILEKYNKTLRSQLEHSTSILEDDKYVGLYWDEQKDQSTGESYYNLKANCGARNRPHSRQNSYVVVDIDASGNEPAVSYCVNKSPCSITAPAWDEDFNGFPICHTPSNGHKWWSGHGDDDAKNAIARARAAFSGSSGDAPRISGCEDGGSLNTCISIGQDIQGFNDVNYKEGECVFDVSCANTSYPMTEHGSLVEWTKIGTYLQSDDAHILGKNSSKIEDTFEKSITQTGRSWEYSVSEVEHNKVCVGSLHEYPLRFTQPRYGYEARDLHKCDGPGPLPLPLLLPSGEYCKHGIDIHKNSCMPGPPPPERLLGERNGARQKSMCW